MKLHADAGATRITSYGAGYFAIGERIVRHGIIISADGTVTPWPPVVPDDLDEEHLRQIVAHDPEVVLLGTGVRQAFRRRSSFFPSWRPASASRSWTRQRPAGRSTCSRRRAARWWRASFPSSPHLSPIFFFLPLGPERPESFSGEHQSREIRRNTRECDEHRRKLRAKSGAGARTAPDPLRRLSSAGGDTSADSAAFRPAGPRSAASPARRRCSPSRRSSDPPEPSVLPSRARDRCGRRR